MARRCMCHRRCQHILRGNDALLPAEQLAHLEPIIGVLIDAAFGYDADSLALDPKCGIHGTKAISNAECTCRGERYSALEFVQALEIELRTAGAARFESGNRPRRMKAVPGGLNLAMAG